MKQTQRLALRVAERRQRHSALETGQVHVDELALAPIERIRIRREYVISDEFKQALRDMTHRAAGCGHLFPFRCDCV